MKTLLTLPLLLLSLISFPSWSETMDDLVERDGIHYKKFSDVPFTGEVGGISQGLIENGLKTGIWRNFREDGQLESKGPYEIGKLTGTWSYFGDDHLIQQCSYVNGELHGKFFRFWKSGKIGMEANFKNGKRTGPYREFRENGLMVHESHYDNGVLHGAYIQYRDSGNVWSKGSYKNGKREGRWVEYSFWDDGVLDKEESGVYKNGVKISD